jgi:hypothetical protein
VKYIIFGSTKKDFSEQFVKLITDKFEMSTMGELKLFLGFQIKKLNTGNFINQAKYIQDMITNCHLALDPLGKPVNQ